MLAALSALAVLLSGCGSMAGTPTDPTSTPSSTSSSTSSRGPTGAATPVDGPDPPTSAAAAATRQTASPLLPVADAPAQQLSTRPEVRRISGRHVTVVATVDDVVADEILTMSEAALADVTRRWGEGGPARLLVVAPGDVTQLAAALHRTPQQVADTAAWTIGPRAEGHRARADQVVVNPELWSQASAPGRAATLRHEFTHVLVRATTTRDMPTWLAEGFAQYLAYRDLAAQGATSEVLARPYLQRLRREGAPAALPTDDAFVTSGVERDDAYIAAWLAVRELARGRGDPAVLAAVRAGAVEASGWSTTTLTAHWRAALEAQVRALPPHTPTPTAPHPSG